MKHGWMISILGVLLLVILAVQTQREGFGMFGGDAKIPYDKALKDTMSDDELSTFMRDSWNKMTADQKNASIAGWDSLPAKTQNKLYNIAVENHKKRQSIDSLA